MILAVTPRGAGSGVRVLFLCCLVDKHSVRTALGLRHGESHAEVSVRASRTALTDVPALEYGGVRLPSTATDRASSMSEPGVSAGDQCSTWTKSRPVLLPARPSETRRHETLPDWTIRDGRTLSTVPRSNTELGTESSV